MKTVPLFISSFWHRSQVSGWYVGRIAVACAAPAWRCALKIFGVVKDAEITRGGQIDD